MKKIILNLEHARLLLICPTLLRKYTVNLEGVTT
jgi:hypothetical protein